jgi:hypothetical protein
MEHEIDGWIEQLSQCKPLSEADVKKLCDKVCPSELRPVYASLVSLREENRLNMISFTDKGDSNG